MDVDTLRDCEVLPMVLRMLRKHRVRATFFITTGCDRAGLNARRYFSNPEALVNSRVVRRYGLRNLLRSLLAPVRVEEAVDFRSITRGGHEVGLHGYEHTLWTSRFGDMGKEELAGKIKKGLEAFEEVAGIRPQGFASPGFKANRRLLLALEDFGFNYSSDYRGREPFHPVVRGRRLKTTQVPVNHDLEGLVSSKGETGIIKHLAGSIKNLMTLYLHPSYAYMNPGVVEGVLQLLEDYQFLTYGEIAHENNAHI